MRLIGWLINPNEGFTVMHEPIVLNDAGQVEVEGKAFAPKDLPGWLRHADDAVLFTTRDWPVRDASFYTNFIVNSLTRGEDKEAATKQWLAFFQGAAEPPLTTKERGVDPSARR